MFQDIPLPSRLDELITYYFSKDDISDAVKSYIVANLSKAGHKNKEIRSLLQIPKVYTVSHLKRVGLNLSLEELELWHNNPSRITLGHLRAISKKDRREREDLIRLLLTHKKSVQDFEALARNEVLEKGPDLKAYEEDISEHLGRGASISVNNTSKSGVLSLKFYGYADLENLLLSLGYSSEDT